MKGGRPLADLEPKWQQLAARFLMVIMMSKRTQHTQIATSCMNALTCNAVPLYYIMSIAIESTEVDSYSIS